jgi:alpha-glucoside transport system permease protein
VSKIMSGLIALAVGVGGSVVLFWLLDRACSALPKRWERRLRPFAFIGPALLMVVVYLVYPAILTIINSFKDDRSEGFVGFDNYTALARDPTLRSTLVNNLAWVAIVPALCVVFGLAMAVLADRLRKRAESVSKSVIFMPMAISAVGASTIWLFVYYWRPAGREQIGLLNAIWTGFGQEPQTWMQISTGRFNTVLLMLIMVWGSTGFAMVLLSAAIKGVPDETIEAARIDGASEWGVFWHVTVPQIRTTIAVVFTTLTIGVLKVFDIVFVMTGGNFDTDVIANRFVKELFDFRRFGYASAIVVFLMVVMIPIIIYNVRSFRAQEQAR